MLKFFVLLLIFTSAYSQINIKAVGDIMLGSVTPKTILPPDSGKEFVKSISTYLEDADIVFGNLEGAIITDSLEPKKCREESRKAGRCYEFGMPKYLAPSLKEMGFTILNMDNNHSEDYGAAGYYFTQKKLNELGINYATKRGYAKLNNNNQKIVVAAFGYSGNSHDISNLNLAGKIVSDLNNKYDLIIVSFHGGGEGKERLNVGDSTETYLGENRGNVYAFARTVIDAGADMVIGHGPHVLRAIDIYKNKLIAYSLGNFLTYGNVNISGVNGITTILKATIDEKSGDLLIGKIIPVVQYDRGIPYYDKRKEAIDLISNLKGNDFPDSKLLITDNGYFYKEEPLMPEYINLTISKRELFINNSKITKVDIPEIKFFEE